MIGSSYKEASGSYKAVLLSSWQMLVLEKGNVFEFIAVRTRNSNLMYLSEVYIIFVTLPSNI